MSNYILKPLYFPEELPQYPVAMFSNQDQNRFITLCLFTCRQRWKKRCLKVLISD